MNKIIKYKTNDKQLVIESKEIIVALFCDENVYLKFDKFKDTLKVFLPCELEHWNEKNIRTFHYYGDCMQYIKENNLKGFKK